MKGKQDRVEYCCSKRSTLARDLEFGFAFSSHSRSQIKSMIIIAFWQGLCEVGGATYTHAERERERAYRVRFAKICGSLPSLGVVEIPRSILMAHEVGSGFYTFNYYVLNLHHLLREQPVACRTPTDSSLLGKAQRLCAYGRTTRKCRRGGKLHQPASLCGIHTVTK